MEQSVKSDRERSVLVVIPAYRAPEKLQQCLESIGAQTLSKQILVYVRDNSEDNIYYTAACNEGIRYGLGQTGIRYFLLLNQDCRLAPDAVERLVQFMDEYDGVGICAPIQLDPDKPEMVNWGGAAQAFPRGYGWKGPLDQFSEPSPTPWANGAAVMIRKDVVVEIGLLDESMRFICSDSDYSFTARSRGWQVVCLPEARCFHSAGSASTPDNDQLKAVMYQDVINFADKWFSGQRFLALEHGGEKLSLVDLMAERQRYIDALAKLSNGGV